MNVENNQKDATHYHALMILRVNNYFFKADCPETAADNIPCGGAACVHCIVNRPIIAPSLI